MPTSHIVRSFIVLAVLLATAVVSPADARVKRVPLPGGGPGLVPYVPPYVPPQPPQKPATPNILTRTPHAISFGWWVLDPSVTSSALERSTGDGVWTVIATHGALNGPQQHTDGGPPTAVALPTRRGLVTATKVGNSLTPDKRYCYRVRQTNAVGTTLSDAQCTYTRELPPLDEYGTRVPRSVSRLQLRVRTGTPVNADTEDAVAVLLNSATSLYAVPSGNRTWLDDPRDDFERGADHVYDLDTRGIGDIGDIQMVSIQKSGGDHWCLAGFDLIVNNQTVDGNAGAGTVLFSQSFASQPGGCLWLTNATGNANIFTVSFEQLRAAPGWHTTNPRLLPVVPRQQIVAQLASKLGNAFHGTAAYWGPKGAITVVTSTTQDNIMHVDVRFKAEVNNASNPDVAVTFDLVVSGGCEGDGTLSLAIEPKNVHVDATLGALAAIGGAFECVGTLSGGPTCIQSGVEKAIRDAFVVPAAGFTSYGIEACVDAYNRWVLLTTGAIVLALS